MCQAYCQASRQGRGQVCRGNSRQAGGNGMTGGRAQAGGQDTGNRMEGPNGWGMMGRRRNKTRRHRCQKPSTRPCHWLAGKGRESWVQACELMPSTQQTFITAWSFLERYEGWREPDRAPKTVPKPKGK